MTPTTTEANGINGTNGTTSTPEKLVLKDAFIENHRHLRVVVVGAGFSGILAAIRLVLNTHGFLLAPTIMFDVVLYKV